MKDAKQHPQIVDASTLGGIIGMTREQVWRLHRQGMIPVITIGPRRHRYNVDDVIAALGKKTKPAKEDTE
jgi:predicted site-specific integrase-resolvase